jgi:hypothetical protein
VRTPHAQSYKPSLPPFLLILLLLGVALLKAEHHRPQHHHRNDTTPSIGLEWDWIRLNLYGVFCQSPCQTIISAAGIISESSPREDISL